MALLELWKDSAKEACGLGLTEARSFNLGPPTAGISKWIGSAGPPQTNPTELSIATSAPVFVLKISSAIPFS